MNKYIFIFAVLLSNLGYAQLPVKGLLQKVDTKLNKQWFKQPDPISNNFNDVDTTGSLPAEFGNNAEYFSFDSLDFGENGYMLHPGFFQQTLQTFCVRAGTPAPYKGTGYMNAKMQGPMADVVNHILWNYLFHETVRQHDVQLLLWAIIAKTPYSDFPAKMKQTVDTLLLPNDINKLKKAGALSVISDEIINGEIVKMPPALQSILKAENEIRKLAKSGSDDYAAYEKWAILGGVVAEDKNIERGVWTHIKEGNYYVRYLPQGYSKTQVQIYMPDVKAAPIVGHGPFLNDSFSDDFPVCFDPSGNLLNPAGQDRQRLVCTPCIDNSEDIKTPFEKFLGSPGIWWTRFKKAIGSGKYDVQTAAVAGGVRG